MNKIIFICVALASITLTTDAFPRMLRGRPHNKYGMLGLPFIQENVQLPEANWFSQRLDHFDPSNTKRWKQRYFYTMENFQPGGPIFLQLGGEGEASPIWLAKGQIAESFAPKFQAASILIEHRYYGQSHPTEDMSVENLRYLTSEQALADAAEFIEFFKTKHNLHNNKWIVFGGSYSGGLAAWMRLKYPHLVSGAVASSAPVNAILDFQDYVRVVTASVGSECAENIRYATNEVENLLERPIGWRTLTSMFRLCDDFNGTNVLDVQNFIQDLAGNFENVVQYNKDNRKFEGSNTDNITIDVICDLMSDRSKNYSERYAAVNSLTLDAYGQKCLDYKYDNFIEGLKEISWNKSTDSGARLWTYQTCTEFGYFQSSDAPDQPFGSLFPVAYFIQQCIDTFGPKFDRKFIEDSIRETNAIYGSTELQVTNVVFPNGMIDPWHALGILKKINPSSIPILIPETAHCADMYPSSDNDPQSLKNARKLIIKMIGQFLK